MVPFKYLTIFLLGLVVLIQIVESEKVYNSHISDDEDGEDDEYDEDGSGDEMSDDDYDDDDEDFDGEEGDLEDEDYRNYNDEYEDDYYGEEGDGDGSEDEYEDDDEYDERTESVPGMSHPVDGDILPHDDVDGLKEGDGGDEDNESVDKVVEDGDGDNESRYNTFFVDHKNETFSILHPAILALMIGGIILFILLIVLCSMFVVYRMRKKDEGSYALDENLRKKNKNIIYTKAPLDHEEFFAWGQGHLDYKILRGG